ncbi:MAG: NUDIX hydrolase [bacterium]
MPTYKFPRPSVMVDIALVAFDAGVLKTLLIQRARPPFKGRWATPGGFIEMDETLLESAERELKEETGLSGLRLEMFGVFGDPGRDPRGRSVAVGYWAAVRKDRVKPRARDDAGEVGWFNLIKPPPLAFDHDLILKTLHKNLRLKLHWFSNALKFLPRTFTLNQARQLYDAVYRRKFRPAKFNRQIKEKYPLVPVPGAKPRTPAPARYSLSEKAAKRTEDNQSACVTL